jgi:hypothetical protein
MEAIDLVYEIEEQCEYFAKDIRARICNDIIASLNKSTGIEGDDYDALGMTYFDKLAIKYQSRSFEEMGNGFDDIINGMIDVEYDNLSPIERHIMDYSCCSTRMECDIEASKSKIMADLCKMIDEHYYTEVVQKYVDILNG